MNFILFYKLNFSVNSAVKGKISSKRCYLFGVFIVDFYGKQIYCFRNAGKVLCQTKMPYSRLYVFRRKQLDLNICSLKTKKNLFIFILIINKNLFPVPAVASEIVCFLNAFTSHGTVLTINVIPCMGNRNVFPFPIIKLKSVCVFYFSFMKFPIRVNQTNFSVFGY